MYIIVLYLVLRTQTHLEVHLLVGVGEEVLQVLGEGVEVGVEGVGVAHQAQEEGEGVEGLGQMKVGVGAVHHLSLFLP